MKSLLKIKFLLVAILFIVARPSADAQRIAVTSNLLEDVVLTPNLGLDIVVADRQSVAFDASFAPYNLSENFHNKRMSFRAGYKYWFKQTFFAHYLGVDLVASSYDMGIGKKSLRDEYVGLGIGYGYSFILGMHLSIVPSIGVGLAYGNSYDGYDQMLNPGHGVQANTVTGVKPVITRLGVTLNYILK